jgi:SET domain-containing protein
VPPADAPVAATHEGPSLLAGFGLFATQDISAGAVVVRFPAPPDEVAALGAVNHSCDPSLAWDDDRTLVALADVAAGTELTLDYATVLDDPAFVLWCHCGTYRCRQVIEGSDWRIPQLQKRYAGQWAPAVQSRIDETAR